MPRNAYMNNLTHVHPVDLSPLIHVRPCFPATVSNEVNSLDTAANTYIQHFVLPSTTLTAKVLQYFSTESRLGQFIRAIQGNEGKYKLIWIFSSDSLLNVHRY